MKEIIKLIDKDFFSEFKNTLNEASGLNSDSTLPDSNDEAKLLTLSVDDAEWNNLFKKYLRDGTIKYYVIAVDGFEKN